MIDVLAGTGGSLQEWIGGVFAVAGLVLNAMLDRRAERKKLAAGGNMETE